jgi:hypothetical protein
MSITYYANKVRETSTTNGNGSLVLLGSPLGFKGFVDGIGANKTISYHIYRQDNNFEWEIGIGYVSSIGGINQLIRERVVSSSNANNLVGFSSGTKFVETIVSENLINNGFLNVEQKSSSFSAPYAPATYIIDASSSNVTINLPQVSNKSDPIIIGFLLRSTISNNYEQADAILLNPFGSETINGSSSASISIREDYLQIVSVPSQNGWFKLDPIQDSTFPFGDDGFIQFKNNDSFSGVNKFFWDINNSALLIGDSGNATADIVLSSTSGQTTIFNQKLYNNDIRIAGLNNSHLFFADASENNIGINTNSPVEALDINANNKKGLYVHKSGNGPQIILGNTTPSGSIPDNTVGSILFSGLNNVNNPVNYSSISSLITSNIDGAENSKIVLKIMNEGVSQQIASFNPSGVDLGFNNSNTDGTIIGFASLNEGNNVVLGYYNNVCGENCAVIGTNLSVASGSFAGAVGKDHAVSGTNLWVFGGENLAVTGDNSSYLAVDNNTYIVVSSGQAEISYFTDDDTVLKLTNKSILASGTNQGLQFRFFNSNGIEKTGCFIFSEINNVSNGNEQTTYKLYTLENGSNTEVLSLSSNNLVIGNNTYNDNNNIFGKDNEIYQSGNSIFGNTILASGNNNIIFGNNINISGSNSSIFGRNNICLSSGNLNIVVVGEGNQIDENYVTSIGINNVNSGLYSFSMGYMNGVHGDYSVGLGEANLVTSNSSIAVGNNNNISSTTFDGSLLAIGIGNYGEVSNTGFMLGYLNQIYGSGAYIIGNRSYSSGNNNFILGSDCSVSGINNIVIGNSINLNDNNTIMLYKDPSNKISVTSTGLFINSSNQVIIKSELIALDDITASSGLTVLGNISSSGNITAASGLTVLGNIPDPTGIDIVSNILFQNNEFKSNNLASSGTLTSPLQLNSISAEYQFLYPTGTSIVFLPNGTGLHMGKKFTIVNMDTGFSNNINVRKSGESSDLAIIPPSNNISIVHGGDNNWIRISYHSFGTAIVEN